MYFKKFPNIFYEFDVGGQPTLKLVSDITSNVRLRKSILENITLYDEYDIQEGDTPEIIAARYYGSPEYHWIIMLANQRYDYIEDFPLGYYALEQYITGKYNYFNPTQWSYNGAVITATIPAHSINVGEDIIVSGATSSTNAPNGSYIVSAKSLNTITFTANQTPTGSAGGSMFIQTTNKEYEVNHYVNGQGFKVSANVEGAAPITNYQYEENLNNSKRRIKLISPQLINNILNEFKSLI